METFFRWPQLPLLSVLRAVWKRKLLIGLVSVLLGIIAMAIIFSLPTVYRAEVVILVEAQRIPERFVTSTVSAVLNDRLSNLKQQILSYSRLLNIVNKYGLYKEERRTKGEEEIIDLMRRDIGVELDRGWSMEQPGAFRISYEGQDPAVVAQVANELGELFIDQNLRSREVNAVGTAEFIEDQLAEAKKRLEEQEAKLTEYKKTHNGELPQQENTLNASLSRLQVQLQGVQDEISRTQQAKIVRDSDLETAQTSRSAMAQMTGRAVESAEAATSAPSAESESAQLEKQIAALRARYTDNHPDVKALRETLARVKEREAQQAADEQASNDAAPRQPAGGAAASEVNKLLVGSTLLRERERIEQLRTLQSVTVKQIEDLQAERRRLLSESAAVQARLQQLPLREQQMLSLSRDYETSKANYQSLLNKKLAAQMASEMEKNQKSERFTVLDSARIPEKPVKPDRLVLSLIAWPLCLLFSAGLGFAIEFNNNVVLGEWELPSDTPILGRVPRIVVRGAGARLMAGPKPHPGLLPGHGMWLFRSKKEA